MTSATHTVSAPPGYERFEVSGATVVAMREATAGIREVLGVCRTLHGWAATLPGATAYHGRATAWGARLPQGGMDLVVRHSHHGGLLASLTGDLFPNPSRAPWELEASRRLRAAEIPTPELAAYVIYPAGFGFCRSDVATRRLPAGEDLPAAWRQSDEPTRAAQAVAVARLLEALGRINAHHPDLNAKNIYLSPDRDRWTAWLLDVDRVRFLPATDTTAGERNAARLTRSLLKWRSGEGLPITDAQVAALTRPADPV